MTSLPVRRRPVASSSNTQPTRPITSSSNHCDIKDFYDSRPPLPLRPTTSSSNHHDVKDFHGFRPPLPLRPARSATNLRTTAHTAPSVPRLPDKNQLVVDFVVDEPSSHSPISPAPTSSSSSSPFLLTPCSTSTPSHLRRVQSSSAISTASTASLSQPSFLTPTSSTESQQQQQQQQSKWKAALGEAQYFAGGLISKPVESTRHYSIIRHSYALIWYRGPSTSVTITILSDAALPHDRTVWLQQKGYSGSVGMSLKAMVGTTGTWIDVTPAKEARVDQIPDLDERGFQRDLKRFRKAAAGRAKKHAPRETVMVRIPAAASDGYFRLVVCTGSSSSSGAEGENANATAAGGGRRRRVLCASPVFRIASTSTDAAVLRGASLKTMPLEIGVKVGSFVGRQAANKYIGVAGAVAQKTLDKAGAVQKVARTGRAAYTRHQAGGLEERVNESWTRGRQDKADASLTCMAAVNDRTGNQLSVGLLGTDGEGPEAPFPLKFEGRVCREETASFETRSGFPIVRVREVPSAIKTGLSGTFAAWTIIRPGAGLERVCDEWYPSIITIRPDCNTTAAAAAAAAAPRIIPKNTVSLQILSDIQDECSSNASLGDAKMKILLMGFLHAHPPDPCQNVSMQDEQGEEQSRDAFTTLASLSREEWSPHLTIAKMKTLQTGTKTFNERLDSVTGKVQMHVDRIPLHLAGIRSESGTLRDQAYGNGGLWIRR